MSNKLRRFEILPPLQFNDGRDIPPEWLAEAVLEIAEKFDAASYETQKVEGHWRHQGILYRDNLVKIVIDAADEEANREWICSRRLGRMDDGQNFYCTFQQIVR